MDISEEALENDRETKDIFLKLLERQTEKENLEEVTDFYNKWVRTYDKHFDGTYEGPGYCADALKRHLGGRTDVSILDVSAGTGAVGVELHKRGFTNIDAVDAAADMLVVAKEKNVYNKIMNQYFDANVDYIESDTYDAVVSNGGFGPGHMDNSCLPEMVRITKPGGLVVLSVNMYEGSPTADPGPLEAAGKWTLLEQHHFPIYFYKDEQGECFILKVTK